MPTYDIDIDEAYQCRIIRHRHTRAGEHFVDLACADFPGAVIEMDSGHNIEKFVGWAVGQIRWMCLRETESADGPPWLDAREGSFRLSKPRPAR